MKIGRLDLVAERLKDVPGDTAEFGCFEGESTIDIHKHLKRRLWAFDTFEGMPDDDYIEYLDNTDPPGKWRPQTKVLEVLAQYPNIIPVKGKFSITIPQFEKDHPDVKFAFVHIDCDHYNAYKRVLAFVHPRMSPGGIIRMDDYECCAGAKVAVNEFCEATGMKREGDRFFY